MPDLPDHSDGGPLPLSQAISWIIIGVLLGLLCFYADGSTFLQE